MTNPTTPTTSVSPTASTRRRAMFAAVAVSAGAAVAIGAGGASAAVDEDPVTTDLEFADCGELIDVADLPDMEDGIWMVAEEIAEGDLPDDVEWVELDPAEIEELVFDDLDVADLPDLEDLEWIVAEEIAEGDLPDDVEIIDCGVTLDGISDDAGADAAVEAVR